MTLKFELTQPTPKSGDCYIPDHDSEPGSTSFGNLTRAFPVAPG